MNYQTINAVTPPTSWFLNLYATKSLKDTSSPSKLEILFLLDSGASISVINIATYTILAQSFLNCSTEITTLSTKTISIATKTEIPILHNITLTCHTSIDNKAHTFVIPFAVTNVQYNILGTPFFEQFVKTIDIENMTLQLKNPPHSQGIISPQTNIIPFDTHRDKHYPYFSYIYTINVNQKNSLPTKLIKNCSISYQIFNTPIL